jgi:hypothetical protein
MTRLEAAGLGFQFYEGERPCKRGHELKRYVSTGQCVACMTERNNAFVKTRHAAKIAAMQGWVEITVRVHVDDRDTLQGLAYALAAARDANPPLPDFVQREIDRKKAAGYQFYKVDGAIFEVPPSEPMGDDKFIADKRALSLAKSAELDPCKHHWDHYGFCLNCGVQNPSRAAQSQGTGP